MNQTAPTSTTSYDERLVNFVCPVHILNTFDSLVKSNRVSRTSKIIEFMKLYIKQQFDEIDNIKVFNEKLEMIKEQNLQSVSNSFEKKLDNSVNSVIRTKFHTRNVTPVNNTSDYDMPNIPDLDDDIFTSKSTWQVNLDRDDD